MLVDPYKSYCGLKKINEFFKMKFLIGCLQTAQELSSVITDIYNSTLGKEPWIKIINCLPRT